VADIARGLYHGRQVRNRLRRRSPGIAAQELFAWLDEQKQASVLAEFIAEWERKFALQQTIAACSGAGFRLGLDPNDIKTMLSEALRDRRS
jgi:hypothetical protein